LKGSNFSIVVIIYHSVVTKILSKKDISERLTGMPKKKKGYVEVVQY